MSDSPAVDSFRYALNPELLKLYGTLILGYLITVYSQEAFSVISEPWESLITLPFVLCGLALFFGGLIGAFHRVLTETTQA